MTEKHQNIVDKWLAETATFEEIQWLWAETLVDPEVLEYMKTVAGAKKVLDAQKAQLKSIPIKSNIRYWYTAAAVVVFSVLLGFLVKIDRDPYQIGITSVDLLELQAPNTTRSDDNKLSAMDSLLNVGLKATIEGKKKRAIESFEKLIQLYPETYSAGVANFNLGIVYFNDGKFENALDSFNNAISILENSDDIVTEKAMWFKTHTLINLKRIEEARDMAAWVYHKDGLFRKQALLLAKKLEQNLKFKKFDPDFVYEEK
jgi:tetratricopeptide (TPR) repeat protein